jgi:hypothetical protein
VCSAEADEEPPGSGLDRELDLVAVAILGGRWHRLGDLDLIEMTDAGERVDEDLPLGRELPLVAHVLPLTAAARAKVRARRGHSILR